jgi:hypothetical protein
MSAATRRAIGLPVVEITHEGDPALVGQRREQHVALRRGDQVRAVAGQAAADAHIGRQRGARVGEAFQGLGHRGPRDAVRTAGADHPLHLDRLHRPVGPLQADEHAVVPLLQGRRRDTALHGTTKLRNPFGEDLLRAPLGQAALELPGAAHARERQLAHPSQARVEDPAGT